MKSAKNRARIIDSWSLFTTVSKIVGVTVLALLVRIVSHSRFNIVRYRAKARPLVFYDSNISRTTCSSAQALQEFIRQIHSS